VKVVDTGYAEVDGTSAATALVSGAAALVRARYPDLDAGNVVNRLITTATDLLAPGRDDATGFGQVDPVAALTADVPRVERNPLAPPPRPSSTEPPPTTAEGELAAPPPVADGGTRLLVAFGGLTAVGVVVAAVSLLLARRSRIRRVPVPVVTEIPPPSDDFWRGDRF
jgi:subtilisin family serine protease